MVPFSNIASIECEGQCGLYKPLSAFSKTQRRGDRWCMVCVQWKDAQEPAGAVAATEGFEALNRDGEEDRTIASNLDPALFAPKLITPISHFPQEIFAGQPAIYSETTVYITGIHPKCTEQDLIRNCAFHGPVKKWQFMAEHKNEKSRSSAYVEMSSPEEAASVLNALVGRGEVVDGYTLNGSLARITTSQNLTLEPTEIPPGYVPPHLRAITGRRYAHCIPSPSVIWPSIAYSSAAPADRGPAVKAPTVKRPTIKTEPEATPARALYALNHPLPDLASRPATSSSTPPRSFVGPARPAPVRNLQPERPPPNDGNWARAAGKRNVANGTAVAAPSRKRFNADGW